MMCHSDSTMIKRIVFGLFAFSLLASNYALDWKQRNIKESVYKYDKAYIVEMTVELNRRANGDENREMVERKVALFLDVWFRDRNFRYRNIKDPIPAVALAMTENWFTQTESNTGCLGEMQVEVDTGNWISDLYLIPHHDETMAFDLKTDTKFNFVVGLAAFDQALKAWKGDVSLAVLSYKFGEGSIQKKINSKAITRRVSNFYSRVYRYTQFIKGVEGFGNPNKLYKAPIPYNTGDYKMFHTRYSRPKLYARR